MGLISCCSPCYQITKTIEIYPLALCDIKRHLRIHNDFTDDDDYLEDLRKTATQMASNYLSKDIAKTLNVLRIDDFNDDEIKIFDGNFLNVVSVLDASGVSTGTIHQTSKHEDYFTIEWTAYVCSDPLTITYYTGYNEDTTPEVIKQAILIKIADLYDNSRSDYNWNGMQNNQVFESILNSYQSIRF